MTGTETIRGPASYCPSIEATGGEPIEHGTTTIRQRAGARPMEIVRWPKTERGLGPGHASARVAHTLSQKPAE